MTITCSERHLENVNNSQPMLVIPQPQINLKVTRTLKLIKLTINPTDNILYFDLVQLTVLNTLSKRPIFLFYEQYCSAPCSCDVLNKTLI